VETRILSHQRRSYDLQCDLCRWARRYKYTKKEK